MLQKILDKYPLLFENSRQVEKVSKGFTNLVYDVADKYIIKICHKQANLTALKKEIAFYENNSKNPYIPQMLAYGFSLEDIPGYLILEKIKGSTLYQFWPNLTEEERKEIIAKLVLFLKSIHAIKGKAYDWGNYILAKIKTSFNKCSYLFTTEDKELLAFGLNRASSYLNSTSFCLVHADIHFDNILLTKQGKLYVIDFEKSIFAPKDYELDIILRMVRNPLKYASLADSKYIKAEDYQNIVSYLEEFYPEMFQEKHLEIRLLIYDLAANIRLVPEFPQDQSLIMVVKETIKALGAELRKVAYEEN